MASRRYWNWEDDDLTFDLSQWLIGILSPGLYRGFDVALEANMTARLYHTKTGATRTLKNKADSTPYGVLMTKQGVVFSSDEDIILTFEPTTDLPRKDIIVFEHSYEQITGGIDGVFKVIQGTSGNNLYPELSNPDLQILIAKLNIPSGTSDWGSGGGGGDNGIVEKPDVPTFADNDIYVKRKGGYLESDLDAKDFTLTNLREPVSEKNPATKYYVDQAFLTKVVQATETISGIAKIATQTEVNSGIDNSKIVTPVKLKNNLLLRTATLAQTLALTGENFLPTKWLGQLKASLTQFGLIQIASEAEVKAATNNTKAVTPYTLGKATVLTPEVFDIGAWDLSALQTKEITITGSSWWNKTVAAEVMIYDDLADKLLKYPNLSSIVQIQVQPTKITLSVPSGTYANFTGTTGTRGYVTVWKKLDIAPPAPSLNVYLSAGQTTFNNYIQTPVNLLIDGNVEAAGSPVQSKAWTVTPPAGASYTLTETGIDDANFSFSDFGTYKVRLTVTLQSGLQKYAELTIQNNQLSAPIPTAVLRLRDNNQNVFLSDNPTISYNTATGATPYFNLGLDAYASQDAPNGPQAFNWMRFEKRSREIQSGRNPNPAWGDWTLVAEGAISGSQAVQVTQSGEYEFRLKVRNTWGGESDWSAVKKLTANITFMPEITLYITKSSGGAGYLNFYGTIVASPKQSVIKKIVVSTNMTMQRGSGWSSQTNTKLRMQSQPQGATSYSYKDIRPGETVTLDFAILGNALFNGSTSYLVASIALGASQMAAWGILFSAYGEDDLLLGTTMFQFGNMLSTSDPTIDFH